jgi:hypothetical protein
VAGFFGKRGGPPVRHVVGKKYFGFLKAFGTKKHFRLLKALGIAPDGPENVIPSQNDIDERLAKGRADLDRRIEVLHKNLASPIGPEIRMASVLADPGELLGGRDRRLLAQVPGFQSLRQLEHRVSTSGPSDIADHRCAVAPGRRNPAFAAAGKKLIAECAGRLAQATMKAGQTGEFQRVPAAKTDAQNMIMALAMTFAGKLLEAHKATGSN